MAVVTPELTGEPEVTEALPVRNLDGYAYPFTDKKGSYLVVFGPQGDGKPETYERVERELRKLAIEGVDYEKVRRAVDEPSGKPMWILAGQDPEELRREQEAAAAEAVPEVDKSTLIFLTIADDLVSAKLTIVPPEDKRVELTMEDVQKLIEEHGITFGLREDKLAEAADILERIKTGEWAEPVELEIAHGTDPVNGTDGTYEFFFDQGSAEGQRKPAVTHTEEGKVDFFAVKEIENTKRGQAVARRIPPTKGTAGKSIRGEEIPARDGTEGDIKIGRGVEHALGNEFILVAGVDGQIKYENNTLEVLAVFEVDGDVDVSTGSIDFIGTVIVKGDVKPGLRINAGEDVIVGGVVDDAEITAAGKVTVKGGVLGQGGKAKITAGGDVSAQYIRNATVETKGTLSCTQGVMHTKVSAYAVKLTGKQGQLVGGEIAAETEIVAQTIGSNSSATPTVLSVGESPARRAEMNALTESIKKMEEELDKSNKGLAVLKQAKERMGALPPDKNVLYTTLVRNTLKIGKELEPAQERLKALMAEEEEQRKHHQAKISVIGTMFPGAKVTIRNAKKTIVEEVRYATLTEKGSEVRSGPFK